MPLHEYECDTCGHRFERIQKFSDPPIDVCPKCGSPVRKLISSPAFQFKGTGFYITDYPKKDSSGGGKGEGKDGGSQSSDAKSSDTKGTDGKSSESKGTEGKGTESKSGGKSESSSSSSSSDSSGAPPKPKA